ncbi:MAG: TfuA-like protein [Myxococcaceae bacterium]|nr:TfuA-like protein [Myxococcaceae bacterium]
MSVVVFLGPSLSLERARALVDATFLPPARQGDVFRVLAQRPRVVVLIDGVFEAVPSVWHHELRAALASGAHVLGASSMGALRAAELERFGMKPVGRIAKAYASGARIDDADVVLLHGDADSAYRPLTVPLVNVQATLAHALEQGVLSRAEQRTLERRASETFYQARTWRGLIEGMTRWSPSRRHSALAWVRTNGVDQKALDAVEALELAARLDRDRSTRRARPLRLSSFVRRRRLVDVDGPRVAALETRDDVEALAAQGLRRLLLAEFAAMAGLLPSEDHVAEALLDVDGTGLAADEHLALARALARERLVLRAPERFVTDGPSRVEGLAFEARLRRGRARGRAGQR